MEAKLSYFVSALLLAVAITSIIAFIIIIKQGKAKNEKFNILMEGLNDKNLIAKYWTPITLIKWSLFYIIYVCLTNYPAQ